MSIEEDVSELRQLYQEFARDERMVQLSELVELPQVAQNVTRRRAGEIVSLAEKIDAELEQIKMNSPYPFSKWSQEDQNFYIAEYKPNHSQLSDLASDQPKFTLGLSELFTTFDFSKVTQTEEQADYPKRVARELISDTIDVIEEIEIDGLSSVASIDPEKYDKVSLEAAYCYMQSKYFRPHIHTQRSKDMQLIAGVLDDQKLPIYVRARAAEVAETYVTGQIVSAVASCRALMEFALADRAKVIGFDPYHPDNPERLLGLDAMITRVVNVQPDLREKLEHLQEEGNAVLHPPKAKKVRRLLPSDKLALGCVNIVFEVLSDLYCND